MLPAQARLRRRPEFSAVVRSGKRAGRSTMVLHYLPERAEPAARSANSRAVAGGVPGPDGSASAQPSPPVARAGFVVGRAVGNSVVRHRVTRRLRAVVRDELHRLPPTADLVVRARPEAGAATSETLHRDLVSGLDRLLGDRARRP